MIVPFVDLHAQYKSLKSEIDSAVSRVIKNGLFIGGPEVASFERAFAKYIAVRECVGVNSGTDALILGTRALELGRGEVIIPVNTFYSSVLAATQNGLTPVFADIDPADNGYNLSDVKKKINARTVAIMAVHLHGRPEKMTELAGLIKKTHRKIYIIEDSCQSHGASYKGNKTGSIGVFGAFSFYPSKNLGAYGDGGAVTTNSVSLAKKVRLLHEYGQTKKYKHDSFGTNSRLDTMQAAVLAVKLKHLNRANQNRRTHAKLYTKLLSDLPYITTPTDYPDRPSIFHVYAINTPKRDRLQKFLSKCGIVTQIHYPIPLHLQKAFSYMKYKRGDFPGAEHTALTMLSLPMYPELSQKQIEHVVLCITKFFK